MTTLQEDKLNTFAQDYYKEHSKEIHNNLLSVQDIFKAGAYFFEDHLLREELVKFANDPIKEDVEAPETTSKNRELKYRYSGKKGKKFWNIVNGFPESERSEMYSLGVALQNLEGQVLKRMSEILTDIKLKL